MWEKKQNPLHAWPHAVATCRRESPAPREHHQIFKVENGKEGTEQQSASEFVVPIVLLFHLRIHFFGEIWKSSAARLTNLVVRIKKPTAVVCLGESNIQSRENELVFMYRFDLKIETNTETTKRATFLVLRRVCPQETGQKPSRPWFDTSTQKKIRKL